MNRSMISSRLSAIRSDNVGKSASFRSCGCTSGRPPSQAVPVARGSLVTAQASGKRRAGFPLTDRVQWSTAYTNLRRRRNRSGGAGALSPVSAATLVAASWVRAGVQRPVVLVPSSFSYRHATSAGRSFAIPLVSMLDGKVG